MMLQHLKRVVEGLRWLGCSIPDAPDDRSARDTIRDRVERLLAASGQNGHMGESK